MPNEKSTPGGGKTRRVKMLTRMGDHINIFQTFHALDEAAKEKNQNGERREEREEKLKYLVDLGTRLKERKEVE